MAKKTWMKDRLDALNKTPADLARALGLQKRTASVFEMLKGDRQLQPREYVDAAKFFRMDLQTVIALATGKPVDTDIPVFNPSHEMDTQAVALLVWKSGTDRSGRFGGFLLYSAKAGTAGRVRRPDFLDHSENAFAFKVVDDKHAPAFKVRDIALVDPQDPVMAGDDCMFTNEGSLDQGTETVLATLISEAPTLWIVRQGSAEADIELPKNEFPDAWRIVGKYARR